VPLNAVNPFLLIIEIRLDATGNFCLSAFFGKLKCTLSRKESGMSHQDVGLEKTAYGFGQQLREAIEWLVSPKAFAEVQFRKDCTWTAWTLTAAAMLWAWSDESTLTGRFASIRQIIQNAFGIQQELAGSYQAFLKMLVRWTTRLKAHLLVALRSRMKRRFAAHRIAGWTIVGVDGSRIELPRTASNETSYSPLSALGKRRRKRTKRRTKASRKKARNPQMWITTVWCCTIGLPWDWRTGRSDSSERAHLLEMIPDLPARTLVTADAGFVGYAYWAALLDAGHPFVIRVGSNVKLLKNLGYARERQGLVYLWPDAVAAKGSPPLMLRLVIIQGGRHPVYLVTSILDKRKLTDCQVAKIYRLRWGVEVYYRSFKQTFHRRKLRSHKSEHSQVELDWAMVGLWAASLYAQHCGCMAPRQLSVAAVLRGFRCTIRHAVPPDPELTLSGLLKRAVLGNNTRKNKTSRDYPRKKRESPPGKPLLKNASKQQVEHAKRLALGNKKKG